MSKRGRHGGCEKSDERVASPRLGNLEHKHCGRNNRDQPKQLKQRKSVRRLLVGRVSHQNNLSAKKMAVKIRSATTMATTHSTTV